MSPFYIKDFHNDMFYFYFLSERTGDVGEGVDKQCLNVPSCLHKTKDATTFYQVGHERNHLKDYSIYSLALKKLRHFYFLRAPLFKHRGLFDSLKPLSKKEMAKNIRTQG